MKKVRLVYLHIEKSAGTSQRVLFQEALGEEHVFWFGLNSNSAVAIEEEVVGALVLGGHRPLTAYKGLSGILVYSAVVREPIERAVSLFNYFSTKLNQNLPGFCPEDMLRSLRESPEFRSKVSNYQCNYLSGEPSFDSVMRSLEKNPFLVASFPNLTSFNALLAEKLGWDASLGEYNTGGPGYRDTLSMDDELKEEIIALTREDYALYNYINQKLGGLYCSIPESVWEILRTKVSSIRQNVESDRVSLKVIDSHMNNDGMLDVRLSMLNPRVGIVYHPNSYAVSYRIFDQATGNVVVRDGQRFFPKILRTDEESVMFDLSVKIPALYQGRFEIKFSLIKIGEFWMMDRYPGHEAVVCLDFLNQRRGDVR